ncbi:MAG: efflux RND transporter periplasmic adaptor subunit [Fimbriimonas sp.]|nr:efflux RND transporter periplasmic adaptor subunit [Fimbriimonas sp.]
MRVRPFPTGPLLLFALFVGGCHAPASAGGDDDKAEAAPALVELAQVSVRPMQETITAQGTFVASPGSSAKVGAVSAGRIDKVLVKEGDNVSAGQLVALLDNRVQSSQTASAQAALEVAKLQADEASLNAKSAEQDQQASVKIASLALASARAERDANVRIADLNAQTTQAELRKATKGNRRQEIAQAQQTVLQAQVARDAAARDERRNKLLLDKGVVSQKAYDDSKTALTTANSNLSSAQSQLSLMKEGNRAEDIQVAQLAFQSAKQSAQSARDLGNQRVKQAEATLRQAEAGVLAVRAKEREAVANQKIVIQRTADAGAATASQALTEIRSPIAGRVSKRMLNPGDTPDNNSPILEIVNTGGGLDFSANLPSSDGSEVRVGMKASIKVSGASDSQTPVVGLVTSVGQVDAQTGLLSLRIHTVYPPSWVQPGTFGTASIVLAEHPTALAVPDIAVLTKDGEPIVYLANGEKVVLTKVETGAKQDGFTEITKGLAKGTTVVTTGSYELSDGAAIKTAEDDKKDKPDDKTDSAKDEKKAGAVEK